MTTRGRNTTTRRRRLGAGAAATAVLTTALGLAVGPAAPAQAAGLGWNPQDYALDYLPTTAADGEITVTRLTSADATQGRMASFNRDGTTVPYATQLGARDHQWGPAGDVVVGTVPANPDPSVTVTDPSSAAESLRLKAVSSPAMWSPFGESLARTETVSGGYQPVAQWVGSNRLDTLATSQTADPGTALPLPDGSGALVSVSSPDVPGRRDLGYVATEFPRIANKALHSPLSAAQPLGFGALDARLPAVAADGTLAFVGTGTGATTPSLFVVEDDGVPVAVRSLGADCGGQRPSFAPSTGAIAFLVSSADCSSTELHVLGRTNGTFVGGSDTVVTTSAAGERFETASWRPRTPASESIRLGGSDRIATGITVSKWGWTEGSWGAVLTSSTAFADAVVAGPLAGQAMMPLLVNGTTTLDSRVLAELKRLMPDPADRFVYVVGGTGSLSASVEKSLVANGFYVQRLAGADRFDTSVKVAQEMDRVWTGIDLPRATAFLADGRNFPDALSAGPAATTFFAPVLLTNGSTAPASVKSYVDGRRSITTVYAVGYTASQAAGYFGTRVGEKVYGRDRYETSTATARRFFPGAWVVGYASGASFPDALTGGALMAGMWNPVVLTAPTALSATASTLGLDYRSSTDATLVFGGTGVVSDSVKNAAQDRAGTQTAFFGPGTPVVANPDVPATLLNGSAASERPVGGLRAANRSEADRLDAARAFQVAAQR